VIDTNNRKKFSKRKAITWLSILILATSAFSWLGFGIFSLTVDQVDLSLGREERPAKSSSAVNYLIVGSDAREGLTTEQMQKLRVGTVATAAGKRSDSMMLIHISKSRDAAYVISIPRDTYALIPEHKNSKGATIPAAPQKINAAYNFGGASLLVQTIEEMTNLKIDHYLEINFAGFANMIDALGGIQICTKKALSDSNSHLELPAGTHILDGITALAYVRSRELDGTGDLGRMKRQQAFFGAVFRKATSIGVLTNPVKLGTFLNSVLGSITTDSQLQTNDLIDLAKQMRNLAAGNVQTLTVPLSDLNYSDGEITSAVLWDPDLSPELWQMLKDDQAIVSTDTSTATTANANKFKTQSVVIESCS
jgi:LCP family protein required for cell wall assembly